MSYLSFIIGISTFLLALTIAVAVPGGIVFYRWRHRMFDTRLTIACDEVLALMQQVRDAALEPAASAQIAPLLQHLAESERHMFALDHGTADEVSQEFRHEAAQETPAISRLDDLIASRRAWLDTQLARAYGPPWASRWLEY